MKCVLKWRLYILYSTWIGTQWVNTGVGAAIGSSIKSVIFQAREKVGQRQGGWTLMKSPAVPRVAWPSCAAVRDGGRVVVGFQEENPRTFQSYCSKAQWGGLCFLKLAEWTPGVLPNCGFEFSQHPSHSPNFYLKGRTYPSYSQGTNREKDSVLVQPFCELMIETLSSFLIYAERGTEVVWDSAKEVDFVRKVSDEQLN